jgi:6-phosphogluconolactonase
MIENESRGAIVVCRGLRELSNEVAGRFVRLAKEAVQAGERFTVALSGGATPRTLYRLLAGAPWRGQVPWDKVHFFWGDERCVPPDHPASNYRLAHESLLSKVPLPAENVHRLPGEEADPQVGAARYADELRRFFDLTAGTWPRFDLVLLGMGGDGHTASLFPGTAAIGNRTDLVVAHYVEKLQTHRLTLTPPVLNNAANIFFLVSGPDKAKTLQEVLEGEFRPSQLPAQSVRPTDGKLLWFVDRAAASHLSLKDAN